jgi:hypothetical protein
MPAGTTTGSPGEKKRITGVEGKRLRELEEFLS